MTVLISMLLLQYRGSVGRFCVRSRLGTMFPLLDGGRTANLKFEQTGVKFATPTVNKINAFGEEDDVAGRMLMIERLGGILKYNDVADKVFRSNLCMIDLHFPVCWARCCVSCIWMAYPKLVT